MRFELQNVILVTGFWEGKHDRTVVDEALALDLARFWSTLAKILTLSLECYAHLVCPLAHQLIGESYCT
jgi:hypothetical protein